MANVTPPTPRQPTIIRLTEAVDKAAAHAYRHAPAHYKPAPADAEAYEKAKDALLEHIRRTMEIIKDPGIGRNLQGYFNTLTYYLTWKDLRGGII